MTIDEVVLLLKASLPNVTPLQELILRSSWEGKTYTSIALEAHYGEERVRRVASSLWQLLSDFWKEPINKSSFRALLESRRLSRANQQTINEFNRAATAISLEFPSGPVSLESRFYISRSPIEEQASAEIAKPGSVICIKAAKKMGKSSLILRLLAKATAFGFSTVSLDFQQADKAVFASLDKFLRWFCANVSRELQLESRINDYWDDDMGSKVSCTIYFQKYLLVLLSAPLVLVLNEVDWVFEYPEIAADFLPLLRSWHEQATRLEIWQKLRLVMVSSTEILVPFDVGLPIKLPFFTTVQVLDLAQRHGLDWTDGSHVQKLMAMLGGHPYLVRLALYHLVGKGGLERDLGRLLEEAPKETGIYHEFLRQYLLALQEQPELKSAFYEVITATSPVKLEPRVGYKLQSMGLVTMLGDRAYPACELYRLYFRSQLNSSSQLQNARVSELEKENEQLRFRASLDELTQLVNRRSFNIYLQIEWQRSAVISLILCDIDYFKIYNKIYGNTAGDDCLRQIANTICNCVKSSHNSGLVARYSSLYFAILLPVDAATAVDIAENIRYEVKNLAIPCEYPGIGGLPAAVLTVSLGVGSMIPEPDREPTILIEAAEKALYQAKRRGRDRVVLN
jgi:diguanylate cyclase (GGDEF)-like protein